MKLPVIFMADKSQQQRERRSRNGERKAWEAGNTRMRVRAAHLALKQTEHQESGADSFTAETLLPPPTNIMLKSISVCYCFPSLKSFH